MALPKGSCYLPAWTVWPRHSQGPVDKTQMARTNRSKPDLSPCQLLQGQLAECEEHALDRHSAALSLVGRKSNGIEGERGEWKLGEETQKERKRFREEEMNLGVEVSERQVTGARNRESRGEGWTEETDIKKGVRGKKMRRQAAGD